MEFAQFEIRNNWAPSIAMLQSRFPLATALEMNVGRSFEMRPEILLCASGLSLHYSLAGQTVSAGDITLPCALVSLPGTASSPSMRFHLVNLHHFQPNPHPPPSPLVNIVCPQRSFSLVYSNSLLSSCETLIPS